MGKRGRPKNTPEKEAAIHAAVVSAPKKKTRSFSVVQAKHDIFLPQPPASKGTTAWKVWAKESFLELLRHGLSIEEACKYLGVTRSWWESNLVRDPDWAVQARKIRFEGSDEPYRDWPDISHMDYREFAKTYLGLSVFDHQEPVVDAIEDPEANIVLVLGFPESGKSTHVSLGYVLYRLCRNPDLRVALISKSEGKAQDLLHRIKRYLTEHHLYENAERDLINDFKGFQPAHGMHPWDQDKITIRQRRSGERDPSIQALGIGGQIYGTRIDLLILDDALTLDNQLTEQRRERISSWFLQEAMSRAFKGMTIVCGTRIHPEDNYRDWLEAWEDDPHFRLVRIPAIKHTEAGEEVSVWPEYWPLEGGVVWDELNQMERYQQGLMDIRSRISALGDIRWRTVYMQEQVEDTEAIFGKEHIETAMALGADRMLGQVRPEEILILGVDPAVTGRCASVLIAYNPQTRIRTVVDLFVGENVKATGIRERLLYYFWEKYRPQRTVVEVNYWPTLEGDATVKGRAQAVPTLLTPHRTKGTGHGRGALHDEEYGIAAMAPLLSGGLYALPSLRPEDRSRLQPLIDDMRAFPWSDVKDSLIALWAAEGDVRSVMWEPLGAEQIIQGRSLPPRIARRLRQGRADPEKSSRVRVGYV